MSVPLLATKLHVPPLRSERVARPRLVARLKAGLECKLTLVSAPAGFGKTTLLAECIGECRVPAAWLSLDKADNDPVRFWTYLVAAMQTIPSLQRAAVGRAAVGMLSSSTLASPAPPIETLLVGLINEIARAAAPFALVLDDLHLVTDARIHAGLTFLLDNLPPPPRGLRLVIATRADPPWPLARLRARGQVTELRASDLRFTSEEAAAFLNGVMGLNLAPDALIALDGRTEGWIAGLQMAALSMQGHLRREASPDLQAFIEGFTGSHRFVLDYLLEEVLNQQSPAIQEFLLKTSILERMSAPLCDAVLAGPVEEHGQEQTEAQPDRFAAPSQRILEQLEEANLFMVPLDDERHWYRYHHLFADLLFQRLQKRGDVEVRVLHLRASAWFEQHGMIGEAVSHALAANDIERVAGLVETYTLLAIFHGRLATVLGWLSTLPEEVMRRRPWLSIGRAWALASVGQWEAVEALLAAAEALILQEPAVDEAQARRIMGHIVVLRSYGAGIKGELPRTRELAMLGMELVPRSDVAVYCFAANMLGAALRYSGELAEAARVWTEAVAASRAAGDISSELTLVNALASLQLEMGQLRAVEATSREAIRLGEPVDAGGYQLPLLAPVYTRLGRLMREWNDPQAALRHSQEGVRLSEAWGHAEAVATAQAGLAFAYQAVGDSRAASEAMHRARQVAESLSAWYNDFIAAEQAHLWLMQGKLEAAVHWSQDSGLAAHAADEIDFSQVTTYTVLARVLIADGRPAEALPLLARLLSRLEAAGAAGWAIEVLALQALAIQACDQTTEALPVLARALFLAEPEGYADTFLSGGERMRLLLEGFRAWVEQEAPAHRFRYLRDYADKLVRAFPAAAAEETVKPAIRRLEPRTAALVEPLSDRELEVLRLLDSPRSTPEIASELVVAVSTVRSHIKNIYGKLGVHGRMEAVHRAKEIGLL
jgi:LuxR family maltose regulon positive regulatory protein